MKNRYDDVMQRLGAHQLSDYREICQNEIEALEARLDAALPADYRHFLEKHGVTTPKAPVACRLATQTPADGLVDMFFGIAAGSALDLYRMWKLHEDNERPYDRIPPELLPICLWRNSV